MGRKSQAPGSDESRAWGFGAVTYSPTFAVPSARRGLTSLFGMGRGGTPVLLTALVSFSVSLLQIPYKVKRRVRKQTQLA